MFGMVHPQNPDSGVSRREQSARERAAQEREQRVARALEYLPQAQEAKKRQQQTRATAERRLFGDLSARSLSLSNPIVALM